MSAAEGSGPVSQGLYGSQGYSNYGSNHGYAQHQAPTAAPQPSQYQSYGFNVSLPLLIANSIISKSHNQESFLSLSIHQYFELMAVLY